MSIIHNHDERNPNASASSAHPQAVAIGMDIGATAIKAGLVGLHRDLLMSFPEVSPRTPSALRDFVHSVRKRSPSPVLGVGTGCKGVIDAATTRVNRLPGDPHFIEGRILHELADRAWVHGWM